MNEKIKMIDCPDCEDGRVEYHCSACNDTGEGRYDGSVCHFCRNAPSYLKCNTCDGTGEIEDETIYEDEEE